MPYIKLTQRRRLAGEAIPIPQDVGELNYLITDLCIDYIERKGLRYETLNAVVGTLGCVTQELYRRMISPYEDSKIAENGDVY